MTTRSEREKAEKLNEQHQAILSELLREDDNKKCADCQAKGPRWASWNLGVFMCIRCAGIHRNLGVHISRVKSVNLDQWTPEQIQSMMDMGNTRARQLYEAQLPENFRRPQTDQAVEVFIRDKYERKKFYNKEATASQKSSEAVPSSTSPSSQAHRTKPEKELEKKKEEKKREKDERHNNVKSESRTSPRKGPEPAVDLLGLDAPEEEETGPTHAAAIGADLDTFGPVASKPSLSSSTNQDQQKKVETPHQSVQDGSITQKHQDGALNKSGSRAAPPQVDPPTSSSASSSNKVQQKKLLSKDSILSLYGSQPKNQQPPAGQAGVLMGQPQTHFSPPGFAAAAGEAIPPATMTGGGALMLLNGGHVDPGELTANQEPNRQQGQWSVSQVTQQTSSMTVNSGGPAAGAPPDLLSTAPASGQTFSTQLWK